MKCLITDQVILSRSPEGPVAEYLGAFADFINSQGYSLYSMRRQICLAAAFSRWLQQKSIERHRISSNHPARYLRYRARKVQICPGDAAALEHFMAYLRGASVIPAGQIPRKVKIIKRLK